MFTIEISSLPQASDFPLVLHIEKALTQIPSTCGHQYQQYNLTDNAYIIS